MMTEPEARAFAKEWVDAWNSHDLDRIMAHYAEDFAMTSPYIAALMQEPSGTITGKANVRAYWNRALKKAEMLFFDTNHQVKRGIAHYISG
jgi:ketosteroid isomerase-like protein